MNSTLGNSITWLSSVDSTNDEMNRRIREGVKPLPGLVIAAAEQTKGRGLGANTWSSEAGKNLTFSLYLEPGFLSADRQFYLNMAVSLAVCQFVGSMIPGKLVKIKWPNDIYIDARKVAGILINHAISGNEILYSVVGIGLNVNQTFFRDDIPNPVSMQMATNHTYELNEVLKELLSIMNRDYKLLADGHLETLRSAYKDALFGYYQWMRFRRNDSVISARITGVSESGLLQLEQPGQERIECDLKEIEFLV